MNSHGVAEHTVEYYSTRSKLVKDMIEKCKRENDMENLPKWKYISCRIGAREEFVFR